MKYIKLFENFNQIRLNLNDNWLETTELVPVEELNKFKEFDRVETPNPFSAGPDEISIKLIKEGIKDPVIIDYSKSEKRVLLIEGNNRLVVANKLGLKYLPARVVRRERRFNEVEFSKSMKVIGVEPDRHGYVPGNMKPSQIGIKGCVPIISGNESLYENKKYVNNDWNQIIYLEYSYNGTYNVKKKYDNLYKAIKVAKEIVEEHVGFDKEKGFVLLSTGSYLNIGDDITYKDWQNLVKWYGNCEWKKKAEEKLSNIILYEKYLYGLEAAYDTFIANTNKVYKIAKFIKEKQPDMWKILSFHDPNLETAIELGEDGFGD